MDDGVYRYGARATTRAKEVTTCCLFLNAGLQPLASSPFFKALQSVNSLAGLLCRKGDHAGAEPLYRRALEGFAATNRRMGQDHPRLQTILGNYAACLERMGHDAAAVRALVQKALGQVGGPDSSREM